jgi:diguanylate cyclase (GGDEF)-like protein
MAESLNLLQDEVKKAAYSLDGAREKMQIARAELVARHEEIAYLAHHDALTKLANRPALSIKLARILEQAKIDARNFAVLSVDLDHFKEANDVCGHVIGDELLCAIARRMEQAAGGAFIARVGGDEFIIISARGEQPQTAATLADRVLKSVAEDFEIKGQIIPIGLSMGAALYPSDGTDTTTLLANADAALYRAKADGRHTVRFFDPEMDKRLRERYALQHELRSAIAHGEPALHYQPQAKIGGEVLGFEALLRWHHPKHGFVPPATFIPARRAVGPDQRDGRMGAPQGLLPGSHLGIAFPDRYQPIPGSVPLRGPGRARAHHPAPDRTGARTFGARDHRRRPHQRPAARAVHPAAAQAARRQDRHGRLRHRLCLSVVAPVLPLRQDQDRPDLCRGSRP